MLADKSRRARCGRRTPERRSASGRGGGGASAGPGAEHTPGRLAQLRDFAAERPAHLKPLQEMVVLTALPLTAGEKGSSHSSSWPPLPDTRAVSRRPAAPPALRSTGRHVWNNTRTTFLAFLAI